MHPAYTCIGLQYYNIVVTLPRVFDVFPTTTTTTEPASAVCWWGKYLLNKEVAAVYKKWTITMIVWRDLVISCKGIRPEFLHSMKPF